MTSVNSSNLPIKIKKRGFAGEELARAIIVLTMVDVSLSSIDEIRRLFLLFFWSRFWMGTSGGILKLA